MEKKENKKMRKWENKERGVEAEEEGKRRGRGWEEEEAEEQ